MSESMGFRSNMAIHSAADFGTGTPVAMKYRSNTLQETVNVVQNDGIRCERSRNVADIALGNVEVAGAIVCDPTPIEWGRWLPYMGFSVSTNTWTLTDALADLYIRTYMGATNAELFTFLTRVNSSVLTAEAGGRVQLTQNLVGKSLTVSSSYTFPTIDDLSRPFMMYDAGASTGITIASVAQPVSRIELEINNAIEPTYMSGREATDLEPGDRTVMLRATYKFNSAAEATMFAANRAGTAQTGSFTFTNGGTSMAVSLGAMVANSVSPPINDRGKIRMEVEYNCYKTGSTGEVVIVLDQSA